MLESVFPFSSTPITSYNKFYFAFGSSSDIIFLIQFHLIAQLKVTLNFYEFSVYFMFYLL